MSLDLYAEATMDRLSRFPAVRTPDPGAWDNFAAGSASYLMRGLAEVPRAMSLAVGGAVSAIERAGTLHPLQPKLDTTISDTVFRIHDDIFQRAVDYWTPKPQEVGEAGQVAGKLLSTLPIVIASPALAVATQQLSIAEDLMRKGVDTTKAGAVGAVQGAGLGLGVWMPILGRNLFERMVVGGAGFNVVQGVVTRGVSGSILEGTPAGEDFKAFDWSAVTLDALLGLAFGGLSHLSPAQRRQGEAAWKRIHEWISGAKPSELDALAALRQAEHLNVESAAGKLKEPGDVDANVARVRQAIDQLAQDKPVDVSPLPQPKVEPDPERQAIAKKNVEAMQREAEELGKAYDIVFEDPIGPAQDPLVRLTPEQIGEVLVERGPAFMKKGGTELQIPGYGLVKFIWKHGEKSAKASESQITREDVMRTPEVLRNFEPIEDQRGAEGQRYTEWQVERADGKRVVYAIRRFTGKGGDDRQHLVTLFVNDRDEPRFTNKPLSKPLGEPESPGGASKARAAAAATGDTGPVTSSSSEQGGQVDGSLRPGGEGAQAPDPLALEAARIAEQYPDAPIVIGHDAEGKPVTTTMKDYLERSEADVAQAHEDAKLFEVAASCMLGIV